MTTESSVSTSGPPINHPVVLALVGTADELRERLQNREDVPMPATLREELLGESGVAGQVYRLVADTDGADPDCHIWDGNGIAIAVYCTDDAWPAADRMDDPLTRAIVHALRGAL